MNETASRHADNSFLAEEKVKQLTEQVTEMLGQEGGKNLLEKTRDEMRECKVEVEGKQDKITELEKEGGHCAAPVR